MPVPTLLRDVDTESLLRHCEKRLVQLDDARRPWLDFCYQVANELLPCATWPVRSDVVPAAVTAPDAPPILVVGNTGDPATPLSGARAVASTLRSGSASRLLIVSVLLNPVDAVRTGALLAAEIAAEGPAQDLLAAGRLEPGQAEQYVVGDRGIGHSSPGVQPGRVVNDPQPGLEGDPSCPVFLDDGRHPLVLQAQHLGDVHCRGPSAWVRGNTTNPTLSLS